MSRLKIFLCVLTVALAALLAGPGLTLLRWVDRNLLGELLKDGWGHVVYNEDWQSAVELSAHLDYSWLQEASRPILVAHSLGDASGRGQNTLMALHRSIQQGIRLLEIDVWLDEPGILRCHHGPEAPVPSRTGSAPCPPRCMLLSRTAPG